MSQRVLVLPQDFIGKTIEGVDVSCVNEMKFFFTDGTIVALEVDSLGGGLYGLVESRIDEQGNHNEVEGICPICGGSMSGGMSFGRGELKCIPWGKPEDAPEYSKGCGFERTWG